MSRHSKRYPSIFSKPSIDLRERATVFVVDPPRPENPGARQDSQPDTDQKQPGTPPPKQQPVADRPPPHASKSRNRAGNEVTSRRASQDTFQHVPNRFENHDNGQGGTGKVWNNWRPHHRSPHEDQRPQRAPTGSGYSPRPNQERRPDPPRNQSSREAPPNGGPIVYDPRRPHC